MAVGQEGPPRPRPAGRIRTRGARSARCGTGDARTGVQPPRLGLAFREKQGMRQPCKYKNNFKNEVEPGEVAQVWNPRVPGHESPTLSLKKQKEGEGKGVWQ